MANNLVTRGMGKDSKLIARGMGSRLIAVIEQAVGASKTIIKRTLTTIRIDIDRVKRRDKYLTVLIGHFDMTPLNTTIRITKIVPRALFNLFTHNLAFVLTSKLNSIITSSKLVNVKTGEKE